MRHEVTVHKFLHVFSLPPETIAAFGDSRFPFCTTIADFCEHKFDFCEKHFREFILSRSFFEEN